jgi:hypothetical protein
MSSKEEKPDKEETLPADPRDRWGSLSDPPFSFFVLMATLLPNRVGLGVEDSLLEVEGLGRGE